MSFTSVQGAFDAGDMSARDPSDLFSQLDEMARAEPISAEDDLILRMQAVSKVRAGAKKEKKAKGSSTKPANPIAKKVRSRRDGMHVESSRTTQQSRATPRAAAAAQVVTQELQHMVSSAQHRLRPRSHSI